MQLDGNHDKYIFPQKTQKNLVFSLMIVGIMSLLAIVALVLCDFEAQPGAPGMPPLTIVIPFTGMLAGVFSYLGGIILYIIQGTAQGKTDKDGLKADV